MKIIDLTIGLDNNCMTCGTPWHQKVSCKVLGTIRNVGRNTSRIILGSHSGTHIDAPKHFFDNTYGIDKLDLSILCGSASVIDFSYKNTGEYITLTDVKNIKIHKRMIFRFDWHKHWQHDDYYLEFPYFSLEAARYLVDNGMKLMALDTPSPDDGRNITEVHVEDSPVHKLLLQNDVIIAEYLTNTDKLKANKEYEFYALPLKLLDSDGAPARIIAIER